MKTSFIKLTIFTLLSIIIFDLQGKASKKNLIIHEMNYYQIIELLKKNQNQIEYADISIHPDSSLNEYNNLFNGIDSVSFGFYSVDKLLNIILKDSKFAGRITGAQTILTCGNHGIIKLYTGHDNGIKNVRTELIYISITEIGFTFNGAGPRFETLFYNPKLANWLVERFEKAGLPLVAKIYKENKNLYEDYRKNTKWDKERIKKQKEDYESKIAENRKNNETNKGTPK